MCYRGVFFFIELYVSLPDLGVLKITPLKAILGVCWQAHLHALKDKALFYTHMQLKGNGIG